MFDEAKNVRIVTDEVTKSLFVIIQCGITAKEKEEMENRIPIAEKELKDIIPIVHSLIVITNRTHSTCENKIHLALRVPIELNTLKTIIDIAAIADIILQKVHQYLTTWTQIKAIAADCKPYYVNNKKDHE